VKMGLGGWIRNEPELHLVRLSENLDKLNGCRRKTFRLLNYDDSKHVKSVNGGFSGLPR